MLTMNIAAPVTLNQRLRFWAMIVKYFVFSGFCCYSNGYSTVLDFWFAPRVSRRHPTPIPSMV